MTTDFNQAIMSARKNAIRERRQQIIAKLMEDYAREYERVNGRRPAICRTSSKSSWVEVNRNFYRIGDLRKMLDVLKTRASFYS